MPALDHLVVNMRVVILERSLAGPPTQLRGNHVATAVFVNFCHLTDKPLLEYALTPVGWSTLSESLAAQVCGQEGRSRWQRGNDTRLSRWCAS